MNELTPSFKKICLISNHKQSYLKEYLTSIQTCELHHFTFNELSLSKLKLMSPKIIVVDQYFMQKDYSPLIESIKNNFKQERVYFLSPEYAGQSGLYKCTKNPKHKYSNFCKEVLTHIQSSMDNYHYPVAG